MGKAGDGKVWNASEFKRTLDVEQWPLTADGRQILFQVPHGQDLFEVPMYSIADPAFALSSRVMKGFPGNGLTTTQQLFNKVLSKTRQVLYHLL